MGVGRGLRGLPVNISSPDATRLAPTPLGLTGLSQLLLVGTPCVRAKRCTDGYFRSFRGFALDTPYAAEGRRPAARRGGPGRRVGRSLGLFSSCEAFPGMKGKSQAERCVSVGGGPSSAARSADRSHGHTTAASSRDRAHTMWQQHIEAAPLWGQLAEAREAWQLTAEAADLSMQPQRIGCSCRRSNRAVAHCEKTR